MSAVLAPSVRPGDSYRHEAFFYRGDEEYLAGTVPMVVEGVEAGDAVMVALPAARLELVRSRVAEAAPAEVDAVRWVDMSQLGRNPANIIAGWSAFVDGNVGRPLRGIGEPVWSGRSDDEILECQLHEALLNVAVSPDVPFWLRCPYDAAALDERVLSAAHLSHPLLSGPGQPWGSTRYAGAHHVGELLASDLPDPPRGADVLTVPFDRRDLAVLRTVAHGRARAAGLGVERAEDLQLAVYEAAANSVEHGGGRGVVRAWLAPDGLVFEVRDEGRIDNPLIGRRPPTEDAEGGRGVFLVYQLCDLVQLRTGEAGTTIRMRMNLN